MSRWMLLSVAVVVLSGCPGDDNAKPSKTSAETATSATEEGQPVRTGHESPEAVFAAYQKAAEADDVPAMLGCLSPKSLETVAAATVLSLSAFQPEKKEEIDKLLSKYGISPDEESEVIPVESVKDKVAFITELTEWMDANGAEEILGTSYRDRGLTGTLTALTVKEDTAQAVVIVDEYTTEDIRFVRLGGNWFVQLPDILGLTPGTTMEAELLAESFGKRIDESEWNNLFPPPIEAVTIQQFQSSWQVTLDVQAQPAGELLKKLAAELGMKLNTSSISQATLEKPVTFQVSGGSRLGAIEEICRQVALTPVYTPTTIRFEPGKRPFPAVFAGPFLFAVTAFETRPGTATGQMRIQVFAPHLPPTLLRQLDKSFKVPVSLDAVTDANNNNLLREFENEAPFIPESTVFDYSLVVKVKNLLKSVESIHRFTGTLSVSLPTRVEVLKLAELKAGAEQTSGGVTVKISEIEDGKFKFDCDGVNWHDMEILAFDRAGKRVGAILDGYSGNASETISQGYAEPLPVRFEVRAVTRRESLDYEFHFPEIPVPNSREMPEQLTELAFEGERPLTLKFESLGGNQQFPEMTFVTTNHSNKDAESTELQVTCLDADGKVLKQFLTLYSEVLPRDKERNIKLSVFDLPQGTTTAKAIVTSIEFTDATEWDAKK